MDEKINEKIEPFRFVDHGDLFSLYHHVGVFRDEIFSSNPDHEYFKIKGGGHDWEFLANLFLDENLPEIQSYINFDSESSMFCAYSENAEALQQFALEFRAAFDDEKIVSRMKEQYDNKAELELEYNLKQFDKIVTELKRDVYNHAGLFFCNVKGAGKIEVFEFIDRFSSISIDQSEATLNYVRSNLSVTHYDVKHNYSNSDTIRFLKFYRDEINQQLARKEKAKRLENNELPRKVAIPKIMKRW